MNKTVTINVRNVIHSYCFVSRNDSNNLVSAIVEELKENNKVILDFSEIEHCTNYFDSLFSDLYCYDFDKTENVEAVGFKDKENENSFNNYKALQKERRVEDLKYLEEHPEMKEWDEKRKASF